MRLRESLGVGHTTVGLLGSRYTMRGTYFTGRLQQKYGLKMWVVEGEHESNLDNALQMELARNIYLPATREKFKSAIQLLIW